MLLIYEGILTVLQQEPKVKGYGSFYSFQYKLNLNSLEKILCAKKKIMSGLGLSALFLVFPAISAPITVQSVLFDSDNNVLTVGPFLENTNGQNVHNGDFTILANPSSALVVGNGIDEWTRGLFDFRGDASYVAFSNLLTQPNGQIRDATLSLVLTPKDPLFINDQFNIENNSFDGEPEIGQQLQTNPFLSNGISKIVTLNLLDFYNHQQLENFLSFGIGDFVNDGRILLTYADDSIVSGASLRFTASDVPEPVTLALMSIGLAGIGFGKRRSLS